ncbi:MAG: class I tRNA ligase family protein, partial [Deltaproteobacteria bacterium]|nr:class I tRNA ligase family protein [Deltaproteobacteria bacterium]
SFKSYGKLSGRNVDELQAGARVEIDRKKRSPLDFALWKPYRPVAPSGAQRVEPPGSPGAEPPGSPGAEPPGSPGVEPPGSPKSEPHWDSPWGPGRPGWHIECSAMAGRLLGKTIDIHHGGQDLIFPHHENEIAQSEAATGATFCRHWVHHAFMTMGQEKMSKSLGNIFMIGDFVAKYGAETLKYIYVSHHYRSVVDFSEELILKALDELERVYFAKRWAQLAAVEMEGVTEKNLPRDPVVRKWAELRAKIESCMAAVEEEMFSDLNTPGALGQLFTLIREINRTEQEAAGKPGKMAPSNDERLAAAGAFTALIDLRVSPLLNVFGEDAESMLRHLDRVRGEINRARAGEAAGAALTDDEIRKRIEARAAARKDRDFKRADGIREELDAKGILLVDGPQGTTWKNK